MITNKNYPIINQKNKIFFLVSLPRSGNTMFGSLMNQNPDIAVTANSLTLEIIKELHLLKTKDIFLNYPDSNSLDNVISSVFENYYKDWNYKYIIDRGPVMTPSNLMFMEKYFKKPIKCIILWRDLLDVLASYIKWFENEPTAFPNKYGNDIEQKLKKLMDNKGGIAKTLIAIDTAMSPKYKHMCHIVKYDDLVNDTKNQIKKIYDFLEIPHFNHNLQSLNQFSVNGVRYDDTVVGDKMHTIRERIYKEENTYINKIPESIVKAYGHIKL